MLLLLLSLSVAWACPPDQCTAITGECQESLAGSSCGECGWVGWLLAGACQPNPTPSPPLVSCNASELACTGTDGSCVASGAGVRCAECQYRGYLTGDPPACECHDPLWLPALRCSTAFPLAHEPQTVTSTLDSVWCEPFQSPQLGCFADGENTIYGQSSQWSPTECCSEIYGPPIGQLVEDGLSRWQECNTYGSFDPNEAAGTSPWRTCSGHGTWDPDSYACRCDAEWNAEQIGVSFWNESEPAFSCFRCWGFWGPKQELVEQAGVEERYCAVLFTPDENGELRECSGHGEFLNGGCVCFEDDVNGYWALREVESEFLRVLGNGSESIEVHRVGVCLDCAPGRGGPACLIEVPGTAAPATAQPTSPACEACESLGATRITGVDFMQVLAVPPVLTCCTVTAAAVQLGSVVMVAGGTCLDSDQAVNFMATSMCGQLAGCRAYTWTRVGGDLEVRFVASSTFGLVLAQNVGSGRVCPATAEPTPAPTWQPTAFPQAR